MIAVIVSVANNCDYCQFHHAEALNHYWQDVERVEQLRKDYSSIDLSNVDLQLCKLAEKLTKTPDTMDEQKDIQLLKKLGLSDHAILNATLIISYFNFVNRMFFGLGVETDAEEVKGYKYWFAASKYHRLTAPEQLKVKFYTYFSKKMVVKYIC